MKVYPTTSTQRKQVCLKTHSLAPRACMPILADRLKIRPAESSRLSSAWFRRQAAVVVALTLLAGCGGRAEPQSIPPVASRQQSLSGSPISRPAPPRSDYVGSKVCAACHEEISNTFAAHPMARSLGDVDGVSVVEDYSDQTEFTPPGNRRYRVERMPDGVFHHEIRTGANGEVLYDQSVPVQFAVGSGIRGRSYLTNRDGFLFMSPIGWYSEGKRWDLSPGYRPESHQRFDRQVSDGCLACHAGRMNTVAGLSDAYDSKRPFLEEAIGCERCHGPGGSHVARHQTGGDPSLLDQIVNPGKLDSVRQEAVCNQCHLQGSRRVTRYGRSEFDFRPGDRLTDIWVVNLGNEKQGRDGDFPAVAQAQQMHESRCYQQSQRMVCTTCHDPHRSIAVEDRAAYFGDRCAECHGQSSPLCAVIPAQRNSKSCIDCHMPRLAATDVPHTSQTDHRIPRSPSPSPSSKPRANVVIYDEGAPPLPTWEADRARGILLSELAKRRSDRQLSAQALALLKPLQSQLPDDLSLFQAMGAAHLHVENNAAALKCWDQALGLAPKNPQVLESLAVFHHHTGNLQQARTYYERLIESNRWRAEIYGRYAHVLGQLGETELGIKAAHKCLELNPTMTHVHLWLAEVYQRTGQQELSDRHRDLYRQQE